MSRAAGRPTRWTERLIQYVKRDPTYQLEQDRTVGDLAALLRRRAAEAARGRLLQRHLGRSAGLVFAGRRIVIRSGRQITTGRTLVIGDDVVLDALSRDGITIGDNVSIGRGATITCAGVVARPGIGIRLGDRTAISEYCHLGGQGGIDIGNDVLFGPGVRIFSENHEFDDRDVLIRLQGERRAAVAISHDCWIGAGATILSGVTIGSGSVIGAGSVVTRDVPANSVAVGNPARVTRERRSAPSPGEQVQRTEGR